MPSALSLVRFGLAAFSLGVAGRAAAQGEMPKGSPFMPTGSAAALAVLPGETIEFAAVRTIGGKTDVNLYDTQGKKNHWIPLGGTVDGMTVLNYDVRREMVVAKIGGVEKVLPLRKARAAASGPAPIVNSPAMSFNTPTPPTQESFVQKMQPPPPASAPVTAGEAAAVAAPTQPAPTPAQPAVPLTVARQEEEARMLVSDLLEIGMAQRKAYEDKQKQAADPNATPAQPAAPAATPNPNGPPSGG